MAEAAIILIIVPVIALFTRIDLPITTGVEGTVRTTVTRNRITVVTTFKDPQHTITATVTIHSTTIISNSVAVITRLVTVFSSLNILTH